MIIYDVLYHNEHGKLIKQLDDSMKICIIVTHYLPHIGGLELATYHLAKELDKQNNEVHIITPYPDSNENTTSIKIHRHPIHTYPDEHPIRAFVDGLTFFRKTVETINEIKPNIIHAQNITNSIPAYIASKRYHIPYIICLHGALELMGPFLPACLKRFWPKLPHIKAASQIIALTNEMAGRLEKELGRESVVIPNGVDTTHFYPSLTPEVSPHNPVIICLSRIDDKKGLEYAIKSMDDVLKHYPDAILNIVGDGNFRNELEKIVWKHKLTKNVRFMGVVPNTDVPDLLRSADIFLLPSLSEGFALTALEAMASGLPIISTPVGIIPEMVSKWNNGIIIPFKSSTAISNAIISLLDHPNIRLEYGKQSVKATREKYSWTTVAKKYEEIYQKIVSSK